VSGPQFDLLADLSRGGYVGETQLNASRREEKIIKLEEITRRVAAGLAPPRGRPRKRLRDHEWHKRAKAKWGSRKS